LVTDNVFSENTVNCSINYGDYSQNLGLKAKQQLGNFYVTFAADYNNFDNFRTPANIISNDGIINNSFSKSYSGFAKIANQIGKSFIQSISVLYGTGEKGIPTNIETTKPRYWKMPEWNNIISNYAVNYEILSGIILKSNLFASQFKNIIDSYDDGSYSSQKSKSAFHSTQKYTKYGGLAIVELNWKDFEQSKFAISFSQDEQNQQANTNLDWKIFRSQLISISAEQNFSYKDFGGLIGLSYDLLNPIYANGADLRKNEDFLNYQVGMNYSAEFYNLFANYSHKSRFPTLKEFYGEITGANTPNPNLQSEFTDNYELGLRTNIMKDFNIRASLYANNVKNLIDITVLEDKSRQFINIGKVLFAGLEFGANYNLYDYLINFNFNYQKAENQTENATSKIIPLRPEFSTNLTLSRYFDFGLDAQIQLQSYYNSFTYNSDLKKYFELPDYNLLNVYFSYQLFKNIAVNASFMNILDELYYSDWGYPQIGFNFNCGIKLNY
jgi:iron complex outermembrane receptor protein